MRSTVLSTAQIDLGRRHFRWTLMLRRRLRYRFQSFFLCIGTYQSMQANTKLLLLIRHFGCVALTLILRHPRTVQNNTLTKTMTYKTDRRHLLHQLPNPTQTTHRTRYDRVILYVPSRSTFLRERQTMQSHRYRAELDCYFGVPSVVMVRCGTHTPRRFRYSFRQLCRLAHKRNPSLVFAWRLISISVATEAQRTVSQFA